MERRSSSRPRSRVARRLLLGLLVAAALLLLSFALPVRLWRTGERPTPPLPLVRGGPAVEIPRRVWVDTDAACGRGRTTDPDDCLALLLLLDSPDVTVVGISTVFGNAPLPFTDSVTRALVARVDSGGGAAVHRGSAAALTEAGGAPAPAHDALAAALASGPLTVVALGPLTNVAAVLGREPGLARNVGRLVAVMGRRPGHLFHPAEGAGGGILFGHGPVFRDFNFAQDREAAARVIAAGVPLTLVPYEAAREVTLGAEALERIARASRGGAWVVDRSRGWLEYWREDVGRPGFYPFDLVGAAWVAEPGLFDCAATEVWVGKDARLWGLLGRPQALMAGPGRDPSAQPRAIGRALYCPELRPAIRGRLLAALTSDRGDGTRGQR